MKATSDAVSSAVMPAALMSAHTNKPLQIPSDAAIARRRSKPMAVRTTRTKSGPGAIVRSAARTLNARTDRSTARYSAKISLRSITRPGSARGDTVAGTSRTIGGA